MRLVCPNCEAKYEVPEDAIPETGRDVQCANCGHAWYQMRSRSAGAETAAPVAAPAAPEPAAAPAPEVEAPVAAAAELPPVEPEAVPVAEELAAPAEPVDTGAVAEPVEDIAAVAPEVAPVEDAPVEQVAEAEAVAETIAAPVAEAAVADAAVVTEDADDEAEGLAPVALAAAPAAAYAVDESVLAILREEAEREAQARRAEAARPLETQPDLGIEAAIPAAKKAVESVVEAPTAAEADSDDKLAARRSRLPDVEEINSTLRPTETPQDGTGVAEAGPPVVEARSSFRSGFLLVLTVAILGSALYGSADALAEAVPALAGPLRAFVGFVDSLRLQLDGLMQSATVAINGD